MTIRKLAWFLAAACAITLCHRIGFADSKVIPTATGYAFVEQWPWKGSHAASNAKGTGTTVWWSEDHWDATGDTAYIAVAGAAQGSGGYHIDIHKAASPSDKDGTPNNASPIVGGDGSPGVGVFHIDNYDIVGARARNPLVLDPGEPAIITFYASRLNTSSHWWELNFSPTQQPVAPQFTPVPAPYPGRMVPGPVKGSGSLSTNGHRYAQDGVNLIAVGSNDVPCGAGWSDRFALTRRLNGVSDYFVNQRATYAALPVQVAPRGTNAEAIAFEKTQLYRWRVEIRANVDGPEQVTMWMDKDRDDQFSPSEQIETWQAEMPWSEVYISLIGVAYSAAEHHPQGDCYLGSIRELSWKNLQMTPVRYASTEVYPKNVGADNVTKRTGWSSFDLRDTQRFGGVNMTTMAPQPNVNPYSASGNKGLACSEPTYPCFGFKKSLDLSVDIPPPAPGLRVARAQLVYDARGQYGFDLTVNGKTAGYVPGTANEANTTEPGGEPDIWMRRAVDIPPAFLVAGANKIGIKLRTGPAKLGTGIKGGYVDRLEVELSYSAM